jgi:hypothetical protein
MPNQLGAVNMARRTRCCSCRGYSCVDSDESGVLTRWNPKVKVRRVSGAKTSREARRKWQNQSQSAALVPHKRSDIGAGQSVQH